MHSRVDSVSADSVGDRRPARLSSRQPRDVAPSTRADTRFLTEQGADRVGGIAVGRVNTELHLGVPEREDLWNGGVQGFVMGGSGPAPGRHSSGW